MWNIQYEILEYENIGWYTTDCIIHDKKSGDIQNKL